MFRMVYATVALVIFQCIISVMANSKPRTATRRDRCLYEYGHSCYGGHGKRGSLVEEKNRFYWRFNRPRMNRGISDYTGLAMMDKNFNAMENADYPTLQDYSPQIFIDGR